MRITCVIDSLNSGGAQRQLCMLAVLLKQRGHDIRVITYYDFDFFKPMLAEANVPVECVSFRGQLSRILAIRRAIRSGKPDVVVVYLPIPNFIVEIGSLPWRDYALLVSERSLDKGSRIPPWKLQLKYQLHRFADAIVCNSHAQQELVRKAAPWLKTRLSTIINCVDLDTLCPAVTEAEPHEGPLRILCVGRFEWVKNYPGLLEAMEIIQREHPEVDIVLDAYGNNHFIDGKPGPLSGHYMELQKRLETSPVREQFRLHPPVSNVVNLYHASDVVCVASFYEGCNNVVCEALACGKPVLAARVGDNPVLLEEGVNGIMFDPTSPQNMAEAFVRFAQLSHEEKVQMGHASRKRAEQLLDRGRFVGQYEEVFNEVLRISGQDTLPKR